MDIFEILREAKNPAYNRILQRLRKCPDPAFPRCGIPLFCATCARRRAKHFSRELISLAPTIESGARIAIELESKRINRFRRRLSRLETALSERPSQAPPTTMVTKQKKVVLAKLIQLSNDVKALQVFWPNRVLSQLKKAKGTMRHGGDIDFNSILESLLCVRQQVRWQLMHTWKVLWLTIPYQEKSLLDDIDIAKSVFKRFWQTHLRGPHSGAFLVIDVANGHERGAHVHLNCIIYGPHLPLDELQRRWVLVGGGTSIRADEFRFSRDYSLKVLTSYFLKYSKHLDPALRVAFWEAASGRRLVTRYGVFRRKRPPKPPKVYRGHLPVQAIDRSVAPRFRFPTPRLLADVDLTPKPWTVHKTGAKTTLPCRTP